MRKMSNGDLIPTVGTGEIAAEAAFVIPTIISGSFSGYSYSCRADVTSLVREYTVVDAGMATEHSPGLASYTVGDVEATLGGNTYQMAHAGWSLVMIYTSPQTQGHQLYLYDTFTLADDYTDVDFDRDGNPGGDISGFLVPARLPGDENVAKLSCLWARVMTGLQAISLPSRLPSNIGIDSKSHWLSFPDPGFI